MGEPHQFWIKTIFRSFTSLRAACQLIYLPVIRQAMARLIGRTLDSVRSIRYGESWRSDVGYADIPISVFYVTALAYLLCSVERDVRYSFAAYVAALTLIHGSNLKA